MCRITVLMTVKNGEKHLAKCMESVLSQTFTDFEFLIFDDGSVDSTLKILNSYNDDRITIFTDTTGYIDNLNRGIKIANGKYIVRMDHDDIMFLEKIAIQFELMENHDIDVCGTAVYLFGEERDAPELEILEAGFIEDPIFALKTVNYIHHSTTMLRKEFLIKNNLKYEDYFPADDYKLWFEIAKMNGKFYMVPQPLLFYRVWRGQSGTVYAVESGRQIDAVQEEIQEYLNAESKK